MFRRTALETFTTICTCQLDHHTDINITLSEFPSMVNYIINGGDMSSRNPTGFHRSLRLANGSNSSLVMSPNGGQLKSRPPTGSSPIQMRSKQRLRPGSLTIRVLSYKFVKCFPCVENWHSRWESNPHNNSFRKRGPQSIRRREILYTGYPRCITYPCFFHASTSPHRLLAAFVSQRRPAPANASQLSLDGLWRASGSLGSV